MTNSWLNLIIQSFSLLKYCEINWHIIYIGYNCIVSYLTNGGCMNKSVSEEIKKIDNLTIRKIISFTKKVKWTTSKFERFNSGGAGDKNFTIELNI